MFEVCNKKTLCKAGIDSVFEKGGTVCYSEKCFAYKRIKQIAINEIKAGDSPIYIPLPLSYGQLNDIDKEFKAQGYSCQEASTKRLVYVA